MKSKNKCFNMKNTLKLIACLMLFIQVFSVEFMGKPVYAYDSINEFLREGHISEDNYEYEMTNIVEPYIDSIKETGYIKGVNDQSLYYEKYILEDAKASIVISHGYTECLEKYNEMIYYFLKNNYNVFAMEHRGHGRSGSLGIADKTQIHVESFDNYITDLKSFMDEIVIPEKKDNPVFLFAHSMGGAIGAKFLEEYPEYFDRAVLSAPMLEINTGKIPSFLGRMFAKLVIMLGKGGNYAPGMGPYNPSYDVDTICTSSEIRYVNQHKFIWNNEEVQRGEASYNWVYESLSATKEIVKKENASKVKIPVLLFQAGKDSLVNPGGQDKFAQYAEDCQIKYYADARHELYGESDGIQKSYLKNLFEFYESGLNSDNSDEDSDELIEETLEEPSEEN